MSMPRLRCITVLTALALGSSAAALAEGPGLGIPVSEADMAAWDINVLPDGTGLPLGSGTPARGAELFAEKCALCHGENGAGGAIANQLIAPDSTGPMGASKRIASQWPYATSIFDYIRRAMPFQAPKTLTADELYAITAYILAGSGIIDDDEVMNAETLPAVHMPARDRFVYRYPEMIPESVWENAIPPGRSARP